MIMPISKEGKLALEAKLKQLKAEFEQLPKLIGEARAKGDLKENAEYHAAKERQGFLNATIQQLNYDLNHSRVVDPKTLPKGVVTYGKRVSLEDLDSGNQVEYTIVGKGESDSNQNKISIASLVAKALLGKKEKEVVVVDVPSGTKRYRVVAINLAA